jgi:2'-5' RNA ligase
MVIAIGSILSAPADQQTFQIWNWLEEQCKLVSVKLAPIPHFSWQSAGSYHQELLLLELEKVSKSLKPFVIRTSGIGIFTGESPILYLNVIKTKALTEVHQVIWSAASRYAITPNLNYSPEQWVPHITLAYQDVNSENLSCAVKDLMYQPLDVEIYVRNIAVLFKEEKDYGIIKEFNLSG